MYSICVVMATSLPWNPLLPSKPIRLHHHHRRRRHRSPFVQAFRRSDFDGFARRMATGEVWRDVWRSANDGFEQLLYETKKTAERIDRRYSVSRRLSAVAQSASYRAREIDRDLEITQRWRTFTLDFSRNWPRDPNNKNVVNCDEKLRSILLGKPYTDQAAFPKIGKKILTI